MPTLIQRLRLAEAEGRVDEEERLWDLAPDCRHCRERLGYCDVGDCEAWMCFGTDCPLNATIACASCDRSVCSGHDASETPEMVWCRRLGCASVEPICAACMADGLSASSAEAQAASKCGGFLAFCLHCRDVLRRNTPATCHACCLPCWEIEKGRCSSCRRLVFGPKALASLRAGRALNPAAVQQAEWEREDAEAAMAALLAEEEREKAVANKKQAKAKAAQAAQAGPPKPRGKAKAELKKEEEAAAAAAAADGRAARAAAAEAARAERERALEAALAARAAELAAAEAALFAAAMEGRARRPPPPPQPPPPPAASSSSTVPLYTIVSSLARMQVTEECCIVCLDSAPEVLLTACVGRHPAVLCAACAQACAASARPCCPYCRAQI